MKKTPWPTKAVMNQIYEQHLWGGESYDFYSGEGSHDLNIIKPYLDAVIRFLKSHHNQLRICDLGCGDFNVGKQLTPYTKNYMAVDIVEALIERNKTLFKADNLEFYCLDISKDPLPTGDCAILRQVLQHLSNAEIQNILHKLKLYKFVIITEHIPVGDFVANKDRISGQGIRLKLNSGVDVLKAPFNFQVKQSQQLCESITDDGKSEILTTLLTCF